MSIDWEKPHDYYEDALEKNCGTYAINPGKLMVINEGTYEVDENVMMIDVKTFNKMLATIHNLSEIIKNDKTRN